MENQKEHVGIFEDRKKTVRVMRNVFIVFAVVYVGLIIWSLCRQNYVAALFDVVILMMDIGYVHGCNAFISDANLAISAIEYERHLCNFVKDISQNRPWVSVEERLPEKDPDDKGYSVEVRGLFPDGRVRLCFCSIEEGIWFVKGIICESPTYWMPISEV